MPNFRRSLSYLWAYKARLAAGILCVLAVSVLWFGGLGMIGPIARVIIDEEGLHGWAWAKVAGDRLGAKLNVVTRPVLKEALTPEGKEYQELPDLVLSVGKAAKKGPMAAAGVTDGQWIIGMRPGADGRALRGDELLRTIAEANLSARLDLWVYDPATRESRWVALAPHKVGWDSQALSRIVNLVPPARDYHDRFRAFLWLMVASLVATYMRDFFRFLQEYLVESAVYRAAIDLRQDTYEVALRLPVTFYSQHGTTDTMSRFVRDTNVLAEGQVALFSKALAEPAKAVGALAMAMVFSWKLSLLALVAGPPAYVVIRKLGKRMKRASRKALQGWAGALAVLEETLNGIRVVKAYTMEGTERRRFLRANRRIFDQQKRIAWIDAATAPSIEAMGSTAAVAAAALGAYWIFSGKMDPSDFLGAMACLAATFDPFRKLAKVVNRFQRSEAAAARIFELQDYPVEKSPEGAATLARHAREIEFRGVSFRYPDAAEEALKNVNLKVAAGQVVAIVGPNGCGKTTLVSLLPRLMPPSSGTVLIDGKDISQVSLRSLRRQIAVVTQDTVVFNATIGENVSYGLRRPGEKAVLGAAKQAYVDEFVRDLPDGYDTMVGQHGATLSGGQKQRISIARAILRDPAILIFDEATSQIDADSERRIHQAMAEFMKGRTTLMIAHRFATVLQADAIAVMNAGRIVDIGTHEELLERCELYSHLYDTQLVDARGR